MSISDGNNKIQIGYKEWFIYILEFIVDHLLALPMLLRVYLKVIWLNYSSMPCRIQGLGKEVLYLRTDLYYGVKSGGSIAHISGVINAFFKLNLNLTFITTDKIPTVVNEVKQNIVCLSRRYWSFNEIKVLHSNFDIHRFASVHAKKRFFFVYQRYSMNSFVGVILSKKLNVPFVLEYNGSEVWISKNWGNGLSFEFIAKYIEMLNLKRASLVIVVSRELQIELINRGIEKEKILINPNGVDAEFYRPNIDCQDIVKRYGFENIVILGFIGSFGPWHGAEILVETFCKYFRSDKGQERVKLIMIGDGQTNAGAREIARRYNCENQVIFTGAIPQHLGPEYLAACDILVAPHVKNNDGTEFFGSPTKLFEYMAMGKAIIASNLNQIGEIIVNNQSGLLVEPGSHEQLANAINVLIEDKPLRKFLGKNARDRAIKYHSWQHHVEIILDRLRYLCQKD